MVCSPDVEISLNAAKLAPGQNIPCRGKRGSSHRVGQLQRPQDRARLVLGFLELTLRHAVGDDPGTSLHEGPASADGGGPYGDRRVQVDSSPPAVAHTTGI